jgi:hypothetical protein
MAGFAINMDGADAAYSDSAPVFGSLKRKIFPKGPQQRRIQTAPN